MDFRITNDRDINITFDNELEILIPLSELVVISADFGYSKGFDYLIQPLFLVTGNDLEPKVLTKIKREVRSILKKKVTPLEKMYYLERHNKNMDNLENGD